MQEIRCPKCGEVFQVDESGYDQIAQQVRDREFEKELDRRKKELDAQREQELEIIPHSSVQSPLQQQVSLPFHWRQVWLAALLFFDPSQKSQHLSG